MTAPSARAAAKSPDTFPALIGHRGVVERLQACARSIRQQVKNLRSGGDDAAGVERWLLDNHSFVQSQILELRRDLRPSYLRKLLRAGTGSCAEEPRIYRVAAGLVSDLVSAVDYPMLLDFAEDLKTRYALELTELWAFGLMLRFALIERLSKHLEEEDIVSAAIRSLWALQGLSWREFVEAGSAAEELLRKDPAGVYPRMDFETRDYYRRALEKLTRRTRRSEAEIGAALLEYARRALDSGAEDERKTHIGYYLIGPGALNFRRHLVRRSKLTCWLTDLPERWPSLFYSSGFVVLMALIVAGFAQVAGSIPGWMILLLLVPASQAALEIINAAVSRLLDPRWLPSMDFSAGIPDECRTLVVVPTLLFSAKNAAKLVEDLEIRYLANRDPNLFFALITDFPDADRRETPEDSVLHDCIEGIERLNARYGQNGSGPFYLFHRARTWNPREGKWMGYERKRGKLNDLNRLLLGEGNWFETISGDLSRLVAVGYVITLDTDTQLPRDTAFKMTGAMAHPLNQPRLDPAKKIVTDGYALLRPRVAVSMESAGRSRLAQIFSGQAGFDPYATSVSDIYQDLHGQASFTGKGIYDVKAFHAAVGDRFPENAILSHDLIEGEHARTALLTGVELVEDHPASYTAFCKRKHRWVRGDWQLLPWLLPRVPDASGTPTRPNPLPLLSRWKIFDNLRRSLCEINLLLLLLAGWAIVPHTERFTLAVLLLLALPAYADILFSFAKIPDRHLLPSFLRDIGHRLLRKHRDILLVLALIPHQAMLNLDAIGRTLVRLLFTKRRLLEWESMAQSEAGAAMGLGAIDLYLWIASLVWLPFIFAFGRLNVGIALVCALWITAPLIARWLNEPLPGPPALGDSDRPFLRDLALRTWRFFADHAVEENNWLIPDNVQEDPPMVAHSISPTNLGLLLTANLAAHDFGYLNLDQISNALRRIYRTMEKMPRYRGHFFNWYDTRTLLPLAPRYVSAVDSGNLAASVCTVRQGCLTLLSQPVLHAGILAGLSDHARRLRDQLPYAARTHSLMRLLGKLLDHLQCEPADLFFWESVLSDARGMVERVREAMVAVHAHLRRHGEQSQSDQLRYWECLLSERMNSALAELYRLAPWLEPELETELRVNMRDTSLAALFAELSPVPVLSKLPESYDRICQALNARLESLEPVYPALRSVLALLLDRVPQAKRYALGLIYRFESTAEISSACWQAMEFGFLFDPQRKLLKIGYNVDGAKLDEPCYDLLASEARTAVFLAIAKGDIPRDSWFRLGRKLTGYRDQRTLISWSGTMFEYLMPHLYLRAYPDTLLDRATRSAIRIQQLYCAERKLPWGISESAYSARDSRMQYQYHAFGVPALSARSDHPSNIVIAPYASMLALMQDGACATKNLRELAARGYLERYGFVEAIDYSSDGSRSEPVRCFMAHHQGMGLLAIDNALFAGRMQERFHQERIVQATEFLLQERMPVLVENVSDSADHSAAA